VYPREGRRKVRRPCLLADVAEACEFERQAEIKENENDAGRSVRVSRVQWVIDWLLGPV
jgi:hypothetical protein